MRTPPVYLKAVYQSGPLAYVAVSLVATAANIVHCVHCMLPCGAFISIHEFRISRAAAVLSIICCMVGVI